MRLRRAPMLALPLICCTPWTMDAARAQSVPATAGEDVLTPATEDRDQRDADQVDGFDQPAEPALPDFVIEPVGTASGNVSDAILNAPGLLGSGMASDAPQDATVTPDSPLDPLPEVIAAWPEGDDAPVLAELPDLSAEDQLALDTPVTVDGVAVADLPPLEEALEQVVEGETGIAPPIAAPLMPAESQVAAALPENVDVFGGVRFSYIGASEMDGDSLRALEDRFRELSVLRNTDDEDEVTIAEISRRAKTDSELIARILRVYGHYDPDIFHSLEQAAGSADVADVSLGRDVTAVFDIQPGPVYRLDEIDFGDLKLTGPDYPVLRESTGLASGDVINSEEIIVARLTLDEGLGESGYAFAKVAEPDLVIDHATRLGDLDMLVTPGSKFYFGDILVGDDPLLSARHLQRIARFDPGDVFKRSEVEDLRRAIIATGLVSSVTLTPKPSGSVNAQGQPEVDLDVALVAAPLRTIAGELGYGSGEGIRAEVSWEHRNLFPPEGMLRLRGVAGTQEQLVSATFRRNNFNGRDRVLNAQLLIGNIDRDAFNARTISLSANLERQTNLVFQKKWTWSIGAELIATNERDGVRGAATTTRRTYFIGSLPLALAYDGSDDLLDPTSGFRLGARVSPEISLEGKAFGYGRAQIDGSYYQPVSDKIVLAARARVATLAGAPLDRIAPSRRLYAGGGGSVRGFGYQAIGPLDAAGDPTGGRSLAEFSLEARVRLDAFGGNFGVVPFIDAGNIYADSIPDFSGMRYGAGIGIRYYTSFGPMRVDVATPINPRPGDSRIGVYISLGQSF